jgi:hypothetical protein
MLDSTVRIALVGRGKRSEVVLLAPSLANLRCAVGESKVGTEPDNFPAMIGGFYAPPPHCALGFSRE